MQLLTQEEKAKELGVHIETLRRWRKRGGGPQFVVYGGITRYFPELVPEEMKPVKLKMRGEKARKAKAAKMAAE